MTKSETEFPFQFCHVCSNLRKPKKRNATGTFRPGHARPASEGRFYCRTGVWHWECNDCIEAYDLSKRESPYERQLQEHILEHKGVFGEVKFNHPLWNYEYDVAFPQLRFIVEIDSRSAHGPKQRYRDNMKDHAARKNHWFLVRIPPYGNWLNRFMKAYGKAVERHEKWKERKADGSCSDKSTRKKRFFKRGGKRKMRK